MARRPKKEANASEWLNTYADMVTLLLCFFVLLFSMSSVSSTKWKILVGSFNPEATILVPVPTKDGSGEGVDPDDMLGENVPSVDLIEMEIQKFIDEFSEFIEQSELGESIELKTTVDGLVFINFENDIMFDGDSYTIRYEAYSVLDALIDALSGMNDIVGEIRIYGHTNRLTDASPNNIEADRRLASNRATSVLIYLQRSDMIAGKKLQSTGMGEWYPVAPHNTEAQARKNRRVEILIMQNDQIAKSLMQVYDEVGINILMYED